MDRERLRTEQVKLWAGQRQTWTAQVKAAREQLRQVHAHRAEFWDTFRDGQVAAWTSRDRSIRPAHVSDFPLLAQQWKPVNGSPDTVTASDMSKALWTCPWHPAGFSSTVKDRVQKGTRCPLCNAIGTVADVAALRDQLDDPLQQTLSLGAHERRSPSDSALHRDTTPCRSEPSTLPSGSAMRPSANALTVLTGPRYFPDAPAPSDRWRYQVSCDCGLTRWFNHWTLTNQAPQTCGVQPHNGVDRSGQELRPEQSSRDAATLT